MKRKRFAEEQIIQVLKEADAGLPLGELCRKYGISEATVYNWKARFAGMTIADVKRLKVLEEENRRLKSIVAEQMLDIQCLKSVIAKNA